MENKLKREKENYNYIAQQFNRLQARVKQYHITAEAIQRFSKNHNKDLEKRIQKLEIDLLIAVIEL